MLLSELRRYLAARRTCAKMSLEQRANCQSTREGWNWREPGAGSSGGVHRVVKSMNVSARMPMTPVEIEGFPVFGFESVDAAANWILASKDRPNIAVALNAEKLVTIRREPEKFELLKHCAFFYPDGHPILWLLRRRRIRSRRIPGVDLWRAIMRKAGKRKVYLIGSSEQVNLETAKRLREEYQVLNIRRQNGYFEDQDKVIRDICAFKPDIVTVAMGSPKQEEFITRAHAAFPSAFYMGVGGTYDVFVGRVKRAPKWMQAIGLEWLYRTILQPSRFKRDLARLKFLMLFLTGQVR